jgi:hypothetical protein
MRKPIPDHLDLDFDTELTSSSPYPLPWPDPYTTVNESYHRLLPSRIDRVIDVIETGEKYEICL